MVVATSAASSEFAATRLWRHNGAMATIQIKNVPEEPHAILRQRAADAHQSLQEYLLSKLIADAQQPSIDQWLGRVDQMHADVSLAGFTIDSLVEVLHDERPRR